jgi:Pectate lyase superfamily protein/Secretion system C-terminal sorting domain
LLRFLFFIAQQTVLPTDLAWNNAVTNFGCVPDGVTDNTTALRNAARTYQSQFFTNIVVYLPKGTYLISDSIKLLSEFFDKDVTFVGEDSAQTIIKLIDNAPNFQDVNNVRPLIQTRAGNQAFGMYFKNLTINTGNNNPGAAGIDYITSNYGTIEHVRIFSPDKSGYAGILMERTWPGPGLLKNITIDGYQYGIRVATCEYSMTFEDIILRNQTVAGIFNNCNTIAMRHINTFNVPKPIINQGRISILDSRLETTLSTNYAIENTGVIWCRNIVTNGYAGSLTNNTVPIGGNNIIEYKSGTDNSQFTNDGKSLGLPIEETPEYTNNNLTDWGKANTYGALPTNPIFAAYDATAGLQAAFNSGKKVIYFDRMGDNGSSYCIYSDVIVPPTVEMITGLQHAGFAFFNNSKLVINSNSTTPIVIDGMRGTKILNNSQRTVVFKNGAYGSYDNTSANTNGKVFLQDAENKFKPSFPVNMWARQYNPEIQPELDTAVINNGGKYWILGLKTEGRANIISTYNAGKTEVLGALIYPSSSFSGTNQVAFKVVDACFSVTTLTRTSYVGNGWFGISVQETKGTETRNFLTPGTAPAFYDMAFYASDKTTCNNAVLPITIKDFIASCSNNNIDIQWSTEQESSLKQFIVQTSNDGINWVDVKTVAAKNQPTLYQDNITNNRNNNFIRLSIIEIDGKQHYSNILKLNCAAAGSFTIYPNPFTQSITLSLPKIIGNSIVFIKDVNGKNVSQIKIPINATTLIVNLKGLPNGTYFAELQTVSTTQKWIQKIVKVE